MGQIEKAELADLKMPRLVITPFGGMIAFGDEDYRRKQKMASVAAGIFIASFIIGAACFGCAILFSFGAINQ